jgi:cell shape-determining protein MreC
MKEIWRDIKDYEELEDKIQELKDQCREYEQLLIDDRHVDMKEFREALRELEWLRILRDTGNYDDEDL